MEKRQKWIFLFIHRHKYLLQQYNHITQFFQLIPYYNTQIYVFCWITKEFMIFAEETWI